MNLPSLLSFIYGANAVFLLVHPCFSLYNLFVPAMNAIGLVRQFLDTGYFMYVDQVVEDDWLGQSEGLA